MIVLLLSLGLFFTISGYNKIFNPLVHRNIINLFRKIGLSKTDAQTIMIGEFLGGLCLLCSIFVRTWLLPLDAFLLACIIIGAIATDCYKEILSREPHGASWVTKSMMQPEVLLLIMLSAVFALSV